MYSLCSDKGIITTSSLSSSSSSSGSPSSSSSPSTNCPPSPPHQVTSSPPSSSAVSSSSSSPNFPPSDLPPAATSLPSSSRSVLPPMKVAMTSSCAACKILRRRCAENCVLAPWFPPNDPIKFTTVHRVFGASNITKFLQELPESQRADAVSSMVYEANARLRDPVYGCAGSISHLQSSMVYEANARLTDPVYGRAGSISHLQKQLSDLQAQLAKAQAEIMNMQCQQANLMALVYMEMGQSPQLITPPQLSLDNFANNSSSFIDDNVNNVGGLWGAPLNRNIS